MSEQFNVTVNLTTEGCITCGVVFALPCILRKQLLKNHDTFYCPNGHAQVFSGKSREEELGEENTVLLEEKRILESKFRYWKGRASKKGGKK